MSYARWGEDGKSDVYIFHDVGGFLHCMRCNLHNMGSFTTTSRNEMLHHMMLHEQAGHHVPRRAWARLQEEADTLGDMIVNEESEDE